MSTKTTKSGSTIKGDIVSASQLETFMMCPRKWWFSSFLRMPQLVHKHLTLGTVLHSVLERWLSADAQGYLDGKPVEIYPPRWFVAKEKVDLEERKEIEIGLDLGDQTLVKSLVKLGTDTGIITRAPGRQIEYEFLREVAPETWVKGYIDVLLPQGIEDHKTRKSKRWAGTPGKLKTNLQMLVYAQEYLTQQDECGARVRSVKLAHNVFIKDHKSPFVKKVETEVTRSQIEDNWDSCLTAFEVMGSLRKIGDPQDWSVVPGPIQSDACTAYGGCAFARICGNMEGVGRYKERIVRTNERLLNQKPAPQARERQSVGSIFDKLNKMGAKVGKGKVNSKIESKRKPAPEPEEEEEEEEQEVVYYPWRNPDCTGCQGTGMNSKGNPCRVCNSFRKKQGLPSDEDFEISRDEDLVTVLANRNVELLPNHMSRFKDEEEEIDSDESDEDEAPPPPAQKKKKRKRTSKRSVTVGKKEEEPSLEKRQVANEEVTTPAGFYLLVNAATEGTRPLEKIFASVCKDLAEALGEEDYYQCDPFKRRDTLSANIEAVTGQLRGWYTVSTNTPDMHAFVAALAPHAKRVIRGFN